MTLNLILVLILRANQFNQEFIMSLKEKAEATAKNIEGKVQETAGNITGDPQDQAEGQAKQAEAKVRHTVEDVKDEVKKSVD
jgi:uncharacterized protein YjbJ (UPF0337 family)